MDIQTRKINLIESFLHLQNESLLSKLENILKKESKLIEVNSLSDYNKELQEANTRIEEGSFFSQEEIENTVLEWK